MEVVERVAFRLTRDGDTEISDDADDLLEAVESELRERRFGAVVRLEVVELDLARRCSRASRSGSASTATGLPGHAGRSTSRTSAQLYGLDRPDLKYEPWLPYTQRRLADAVGRRPVRRDRAARHRRAAPVRLVRDERRGVRARGGQAIRTSSTLKTTVYRTSHDSALAPALIEAAENGKQSVCVVELKARFDERRNIEWARSLEQAGVHVVYGFPDMKIHAKTTLVVRREGDELQRYVHIGTGNYHATTARIYEDVGLFTADPDIAADVADLFNFVTGFGRPQQFRKILAAPFNLRRRLIEHIRAVASAAEAGKTRGSGSRSTT